MKESKYYTPDIKEFRVGFEYELYVPNKIGSIDGKFKVHKATPYLWHDMLGVGLYELLKNGSIRVKYLDRQDIEELGFTYLEDQGMSENYGYRFTIPDNTFSRSFYHLFYWKNSNRLKIERPFMGCIFDGTIKNKSELKELLEKLGISYNS